MAELNLKTLASVLARNGAPADLTERVMLDVRAKVKAKKQKTPDAAQWDALLTTLQQDRRVMRTNMHNRNPKLRPIYDEYLAIMDKVKERIEIARMHGTLDEATKAAALVNEQRAQEGARPAPANGDRWQTWVPPHVKQAFIGKVEQAYAQIGHHKGNRFTPFVPAAEKKAAHTREQRLRKAITLQREVHENAPGTGVAYTPYRALYLCAARMAEIQLWQRLKAYESGAANPVDNPLPVNWLALLDGPMRARLRAAQENPALVSPEGLGHFLVPAPDNVLQDMTDQDIEHAAAHPVEDVPDADGQE